MTTDAAPLSVIQEALWRRSLLLPTDRAFVESGMVRLDGPLDLPAFERAAQALLESHPEFGARIVGEDADPALRFNCRKGDGLEFIDLGGRPRAERLREAQQLLTEVTRAPIDPRKDDVVRMRLVRMDAEHHRLVVAAHPMIVDRVSMAMAFDELTRNYAALVSGKPVAIHEHDVDAEEVRQHRAAALRRREDAAAFWAQVLPDELEQLCLPRARAATDPLPSVGGPGGHAPCLIPPRLVRAARKLAEDLDTTVFVVMLAALASLVYRYGGHRVVPLLVPVDTRRAGDEGRCGAFTTSLPVIAEVDGDASFTGMVEALRDRFEDTKAQAGYPFRLLMDTVDIESGELRPLTQVGARYVQRPRIEAQIGDLRIALERQRSTRADVDLQLEVFDHGDALEAGFNHSTELFGGGTIARIAGHFRTLLAFHLENPAERVDDAQVLTAAEERQIRYLWNRTEVPFNDDATVHGLMEMAASAYPGPIAVSYADQQLTYGEFNAAANRVAHRLRALGAGQGSRVCVLLDRSVEMPVALVAILKAGAAYVPLETDLPPERLAFMIADAGARVLVTMTDLVPVGLDDDVAVLALDGDAEAIAAEDDSDLPATAAPGDIAYILYTSGSTGMPKAAQIRHVGVVNLISWIADEYALSSDDRVLLKTPYSHDISVPEFFVPLSLGGRLVIAPPDAHRDPNELVDLITREGITVVHFVPTMLREFLATPAVETCTSLRHVFVGGEALTRDLIEQFSATLDAELHNVYGPTEATDYTTAWTVQPDTASIAPIGRPIANMRTYVVDSQLRLLPAGVPGELCVAGIGVGAGYRNRPELNAERFVDNPFEGAGGRLYRSGDICMWRADGTLEFVRRDDGQVKIRGHRVEVGEVEAALLHHPGLAEAAVIMREDEPGVRRLAAYVVVAEKDEPPTVTQMRAWCAERVPEYAIPSNFIALPALPRTVSGKLDRRALPAPGGARPDIAADYVPPRTDAERTLAAIWCEVLGLSDIGVRDSFFQLGGDSILAIRITGRAQRAGLSVSVRTMFAHDTIEAQAKLALAPDILVTAPIVVAGSRKPMTPIGWLDEAALTTLRKSHPSIEDAYPLTPMQQGMLFHTLLAAGAGDYVEQVVGVVAGVDADVVEGAWVNVLNRHAALRTSVGFEVGEPVAIVHSEIVADIDRLDWTGLTEGEQQRELDALLGRDRAEDFDPARPPMWRLYIARLDDGQVQCVWSHHHLLLDGWSVARLLADVNNELSAVVKGIAAESTPTRSQREHSARLLRKDDARARAFWSEELAGVREGSGLSLAPPVDVSRTGRGRVQRRIGSVDRFCRSQRITTATLLHGAIALLLSRYAATNDIVFGTAVSGRSGDLRHIDEVVGCLLNTIPVRVDADGSMPVGDWLRGLQARQARARSHDHIALADIQRELNIADGQELIRFLLVFEDYHYGGGQQMLRDVEVVEAAHVPVIASFSGDADGIGLRMSYSRALFADVAMEAVARHLTTLLGELVADASRALDEVEMLDADERRVVVAEFNATAAATGDEPVHRIIGRVDPSRVALRFDGGTTTYMQLNADANRLAHAMREHGAGRDVAVAICMQRSPAIVTAKLAALRAGAAYLPLDPEHPARRLEFMLGDASAPLVVVDAAGRAALAGYSGDAVFLDIERDAERIAALPSDAPAVDVGLDDLAYILYTSGSTGEPKGVAQTHRTVANMFGWIVDSYGLGPQDRWLFKTPSTFDVSVPDVFFPLAFGGEVVIAPPGAHTEPAELVELITGEQVTVVQFVPSMLDAFLDHPRAPDCVSLRYIMAAGEKLSRQVVDRCIQALPGVDLRNLYGPTETFYVTDVRCHAGAVHDPPIGAPFANLRGYVLDQRGQPVPVGVTGELWMAGAGVARGYIGRDELTAQRFAADPFTDGDQRMYRTGDLARWRPDGQLEYLGRIDDQVKLHGQRIELGEIEAVVRAHPSVERAAVTVHEGAGGRQRLVGYIVGDGEDPPDHDEIAAAVRDRLPRSHVPSAWMTLDALPVTANGKLDRRALPEPPSTAGEPIAPRTPLELTLCTLWGEVLGGRPLGIHDDVFVAGADSLSSVRFAGRAQAQGVDVEVKTVFAHPTVAGLAAVLESTGDAPAGPAHGQPDWSAEIALGWPPRQAGLVGSARDAVLPTRAARAVFLTGANGFVGTHLLAALLEAGPHDVYALVRAADDASARERLVESLALQRLTGRVDLDRVVVLSGDLGLREFGLGAAAFARLGKRLDAVVHAGARVHHLLSYPHLRGPNVDGTREAIRLAAHADGAPLLFVSTTAASLALDGDGWRLRDDADAPVMAGGYPETKWVADRLVLAARKHGLDARTIRLPRVMGDSVTGACSLSDAALLLLKGCIQAGGFPDFGGWEAWAPVDRAARAMAAAAHDDDGPGIGYIETTPVRFDELFNAVCGHGWPLQPLSAEEFRRRVEEQGETNAALLALPDYGLESDGDPALATAPLLSELAPVLGERASTGLDTAYFDLMLGYLVDVGFLPAPGT